MIGTKPNITVTEKAAQQLQKLMQLEGKEGYGLRVGVKSGGCSGLSYYMEFVEKPLPNDQEIEVDGVKIYVDVFSAMYLNGSQLDYTDGLNGAGFVWNNPNAQRTCGCGQSFSA
ncbi:MAG: iron-sulfur cluster assembly accessory protein [Methanobacteriota archaeon]|nr:MAG: iron-sulfur cluster assembly accessory protein [Euryarchaeota archaeon]